MRIIFALALFSAVVVYSVPSAEGRRHRSWKKNSIGHHYDSHDAGFSSKRHRHHRKHEPSSSSSSSSSSSESESHSHEKRHPPYRIHQNHKTSLRPQIRHENPKVHVQNPQTHVDRPVSPVIHKKVGGKKIVGLPTAKKAASPVPAANVTGRGFNPKAVWENMVNAATSAKNAVVKAASSAHETASEFLNRALGNPKPKAPGLASDVMSKGTVLAQDKGTELAHDKGAVLVQDKGTELAHDKGTVLVQDKGTELAQDKGTEAKDTGLAQDKGTELAQDVMDKGAALTATGFANDGISKGSEVNSQ